MTAWGGTGRGDARTPKHTATPSTRAIGREELLGDPRIVARDLLLGATLWRTVEEDLLAVRLVEVEAYLGERDPGSHAFRGPTPRNRIMYGSPGHAYVYFSYGSHWMLNVVLGPPGEAGAALLRGAEPLFGQATMIRLRGTRSRARTAPPEPGDRGFVPWLLGGPARLAQALGVDRSDYGLDMTLAGPPPEPPRGRVGRVPDLPPRGFLLCRGEPLPPDGIITTTRIGLTHGADLPYRYYLAGSAGVSRPLSTRPAPGP